MRTAFLFGVAIISALVGGYNDASSERTATGVEDLNAELVASFNEGTATTVRVTIEPHGKLACVYTFGDGEPNFVGPVSASAQLSEVWLRWFDRSLADIGFFELPHEVFEGTRPDKPSESRLTVSLGVRSNTVQLVQGGARSDAEWERFMRTVSLLLDICPIPVPVAVP